MLRIEDISVSYGQSEVLSDVSLDVREGECVALIGANGAGKSTTLKTISGLLHPTAGKIEFQGQRIDQMPAPAIVGLGIAHVPEGRRVFPGLTVLENLEVGAASRGWRNLDLSRDIDRVFSLFPILEPRSKQRAWSMSGGEQQMLAIGRALMARPTLLLMDEPSLGLAPILVEELGNTIGEIREEGTTILLVEQNADMALRMSDRGYVLETGRVVLQGDTEDLARSPKVKEAYLGA
jgi:branched-chain amino acid transport system ATP-binding protein